MKTIILNRDPNGDPNGMTAKQWDAKIKLLKSTAFKRDIRVNMNRVIRAVVKERLAKLEEKRQEAMKNWTKRP